MPLKIFFDLDNTLINAEIIKEHLFKLAVKSGETAEQAVEIYKKARFDAEGKNTISLQSYVVELAKSLLNKGIKLGYNEDLADEFIAKLKKDKRFILPGALELLNFCRQEKLDIHLLSLGIATWQKMKVKAAGIDNYFSADKIIFSIVEGEGKKEALAEYCGKDFTGKEAVIFNDKPKETEILLQKFPELVAFQIFLADDKRYTEKDYEDLKNKYKNRFFYDNNLNGLLNKFKQIYLYVR